jgi:hypothetical protein
MGFSKRMSRRSTEGNRSGHIERDVGREERVVRSALVDQFEFVGPIECFFETKAILSKTGDTFHTFQPARFGEVCSASVERGEEHVATSEIP